MLITSSERRRRLLRDELWYQGNLRYLIRERRPHAQLSLYDWIHGWKKDHPDHPGPLCLTTHRRLGKTYLIGDLSTERAIARPNQIIKVGSPYFKQTREIMRKILPKILKDCPRPLLPEQSGPLFTFRNPRWQDRAAVSEIQLVGVNLDRGDRLRGTDLDLAIMDEVRDIPNILYIQDDILWPQFLDRELPLLIYTTSEPKTQAHDYVSVIRTAARRDGRAKTFRVANTERDALTPPDPEENLDWTAAHERLVLRHGSITKDSATWRREYMCEEVPDLEALIVPEFQAVQTEVVYPGEDYTEAHPGRPAFFFPYMCGDIGYIDYTALLWGFHDFEEDLLVIEAEKIVNRSTPKEIARHIHEMEKSLYPEHYSEHRILRYSDAQPITLAGLTLDEKTPIMPVEKPDLHEWIARLRTRFSAKKIRISARCKELVYQLRNGIWENEKRKDFIRSETLGHCDALAALIYLNRMVNTRANPFPIQHSRRHPDKHYPAWDPPPGPTGGSLTHESTVIHTRTTRGLGGGTNPFR